RASGSERWDMAGNCNSGRRPGATDPPGHQFQRPARRNNAGPMASRTTVASSSTATASAKPSILMSRKSPRVKAANTTIMMAAALVITPAVRASPSASASPSARPARRAPEPRAQCDQHPRYDQSHHAREAPAHRVFIVGVERRQPADADRGSAEPGQADRVARAQRAHQLDELARARALSRHDVEQRHAAVVADERATPVLTQERPRRGTPLPTGARGERAHASDPRLRRQPVAHPARPPPAPPASRP